MAEQILNIRRRIREIEAILARSKSDYFNLGIEKPLKARAALEAELADLRLMRFDMEDLERARQSKVRVMRAELLKARLKEMGLLHIFTECNAEAEEAIPPVEHLEVNHG